MLPSREWRRCYCGSRVFLERDSIEFLPQELFANLMRGEEYRADIVVKARLKWRFPTARCGASAIVSRK